MLKDKSESLVFQGRTQVIMNLGGVPYIDSGGLGQLVACYATLARARGRLTLLSLNNKNHDLLSITKLVAIFDTFDSEREAIESYAAAAPLLGPGLRSARPGSNRRMPPGWRESASPIRIAADRTP